VAGVAGVAAAERPGASAAAVQRRPMGVVVGAATGPSRDGLRPSPTTRTTTSIRAPEMSNSSA